MSLKECADKHHIKPFQAVMALMEAGIFKHINNPITPEDEMIIQRYSENLVQP